MRPNCTIACAKPAMAALGRRLLPRCAALALTVCSLAHLGILAEEPRLAPRQTLAGLAGLDAGVCIYVTADDAGRAVELGQSGRVLLQVLCPTAAATGQVRTALTDAKLYGLVSAETRARLDVLPYADRLVNALVIADLAEAEQRQLSWAEVLRVTAPGGCVLVGGATAAAIRERLVPLKLEARVEECIQVGEWVRLRTSRTWGDEWTHNRIHDAGKLDLALDPLNAPLQHLWPQWIDGELNPVGSHAAMAALICARGRFISLSDVETGAYIRDGQVWQTSVGPLLDFAKVITWG